MVNILCLVYKKKLIISEEHMVCSNNHSYKCEKGVYRLLTDKQQQFLEHYLNCFNAFRSLETTQKINTKNVNKLPFVNFDDNLWKLRRMDLKLIKKHTTTDKSLNILDIGTWNSWLSHNLAKQRHNVTAIDYFNAPFKSYKPLFFKSFLSKLRLGNINYLYAIYNKSSN